MTKEEFNKKLQGLNINKKEFAYICQVPYPTIINWGITKKGKQLPIPPWVESYLNYYEKSKKFDYLINEVCNKAKNL